MRKIGFGFMILIAWVSLALSATTEKWLHIKVDSTAGKTEHVRVNIPLEMAEKILPAINHEHLRQGKVQIGEAKVNDVDLRAVMDAIRNAKDNEFVSVDSDDESVRVAKEGGNLVIKAKGSKKHNENVHVTIPLTVVDALLSGGKNELDLVAAIRALSAYGDAVLVTVTDGTDNVKIWVDSLSTVQ